MAERRLFCSLTTDSTEFATLRPYWNELAGRRPLLSWEWLYSWWETFGSGCSLRLVLVRDESGSIVGIAPWYKVTTSSGARVIRCLGSGVACTDYFSCICYDSERPRVEHFLADQVLRNAELADQIGPWDLLELEGHTQREWAHFLQVAGDCGATLYNREIEGSWVTALESSFPLFEARLHKSFRRKTRRARKNLSRSDVKCEVATTPDELTRHWDCFRQLHQRRRESLGQKGCFADPRFDRFLQSATARLAERGMASLGLLQVGSSTIASVLLLHTGSWSGDFQVSGNAVSSRHTVYQYQSGLEPEASSWEPGYMLTTGVIDRAIRRGYQEFDFLRGDEPYKRKWGAARRALYKSRVVPLRMSSRLRHQIWLAGKSFKDRLQGLRPDSREIVSAQPQYDD